MSLGSVNLSLIPATTWTHFLSQQRSTPEDPTPHKPSGPGVHEPFNPTALRFPPFKVPRAVFAGYDAARSSAVHGRFFVSGLFKLRSAADSIFGAAEGLFSLLWYTPYTVLRRARKKVPKVGTIALRLRVSRGNSQSTASV